MYLIEIPHQTTTANRSFRAGASLYLIEIPHQTTTGIEDNSEESRLYLIEIPHQTTTCHHVWRFPWRCILSKFHIKPQQSTAKAVSYSGCILSKFHIKPQLVPVFISTLFVVSYRNSTSNHNSAFVTRLVIRLYLIEIPHQTTTCGKCEDCLRRCILSKFHIKPQPVASVKIVFAVVSYRNSTSNHNILGAAGISAGVVSYRNSTSNHNSARGTKLVILVVSYRNSTSNHNSGDGYPVSSVLYLIEIPHQTTTVHQRVRKSRRCILSKFHIKPQLVRNYYGYSQVVSYRNSTSNHNLWQVCKNW